MRRSSPKNSPAPERPALSHLPHWWGLLPAIVGTHDVRLGERTSPGPFGLGVGKVFKLGETVVNAFIEPQFSAYSKGSGQPQWQVFSGINFQ